MAEKKIIISGEIGFFGTMPSDVRAQLIDAAGGDIDVHISSPGGWVNEGVEIFNLIRDYKRDNPNAQVIITLKGEAASMASYLAVNPAADLVLAEDNATFMIHNPWNLTIGDYRDMDKSSEILRGVGGILNRAYANRSKKSNNEIKSMMDAETWYFGAEIKEAGFVDEIIQSPEKNKIEKEEAVAISKLHLSALKDKMQKHENAKSDLLKVAALFKYEIQANTTLNNTGDSSPEKIKGGTSMAEDEKNLINADDINLDWLKANKPDMVESIKKAAAEEEKERIKEIDETEETSEDESEETTALFKAAKYGEEPMNAGEVAKKLFAMTAEKKKKLKADREDDAKKIPAAGGQALKDESDAVMGIVAGIKSRRRSK